MPNSKRDQLVEATKELLCQVGYQAMRRAWRRFGLESRGDQGCRPTYNHANVGLSRSRSSFINMASKADPQTGPNTPSVRSTPRQILLILDDEDGS
jgi:hypothetical protein